jgi:uncharacterized damage-inducible protein DinB
MLKEILISDLKASREFFNRSTDCLQEEDSKFAPKEGMFTVASQVAHAAHTVDWAIEGYFGKGFDMDFGNQTRIVMAVSSLNEARAWYWKSMDKAIKLIESKSEAELHEQIPSNPITNGARYRAVSMIVEHTSHHRGALSVYSRLLGKTPKMPYADM